MDVDHDKFREPNHNLRNKFVQFVSVVLASIRGEMVKYTKHKSAVKWQIDYH